MYEYFYNVVNNLKILKDTWKFVMFKKL